MPETLTSHHPGKHDGGTYLTSSVRGTVAGMYVSAEEVPGSEVLPRHRHTPSYATLVLHGGYEESGDQGRIRVEAGDIVVHAAFEAHLNRFAQDGARVFNLELPMFLVPRGTLCRVADFDRLLQLAERDRVEAASVLVRSMKPVHRIPADWPEILAGDILRDGAFSLARWAEEHGLAPETISRGFCAVFGVSPSAFRVQHRARSAWFRICSTNEPLAAIAFDLSFSDQPHMTRAVTQLTARTPAEWRRLTSNSFKTPQATRSILAS